MISYLCHPCFSNGDILLFSSHSLLLYCIPMFLTCPVLNVHHTYTMYSNFCAKVPNVNQRIGMTLVCKKYLKGEEINLDCLFLLHLNPLLHRQIQLPGKSIDIDSTTCMIITTVMFHILLFKQYSTAHKEVRALKHTYPYLL